MKKDFITIALLGIAIGVLGTLTFEKYNERTRTIRAGYENWTKLNAALNCIEKNYVDSIDKAKVTEAALIAGLAALDPHSTYMEPRILKDSEDDLAGNFDGIGIQFNVPNDTAVVIEVIAGGPSEKIGILPGDRILKVDDKVIAGVKFPQDSMVRRMRGKAGTKVLITINRNGETIPFDITRGKIPTHSVDAAFMVSDTVGYLRLSKFARTTSKEFIKASRELTDKGMRKMVLDIRDNSGGFLDQALLLADQFLPKGAPIVYMEGRHREREDYKADGLGILKDISLDILISENSASSSEILAGAIQDNDRGRIIGRRSFGKGLVQEPFNFKDGSGLRITVARFYTPSGRCIQKPYADDYAYDIYKRYADGEMTEKDSIKIDRSTEYKTAGGRIVYGGGGIIPDIFVPVDTTKASRFYINCSKKATTMRFASAYFDHHKDNLSGIDNYGELISYLDNAGLEAKFLKFAKEKDGLVPGKEWKGEKEYMMTQVRALIGRYSKLGDNAFYHLYLNIDETFRKSIEE